MPRAHRLLPGIRLHSRQIFRKGLCPGKPAGAVHGAFRRDALGPVRDNLFLQGCAGRYKTQIVVRGGVRVWRQCGQLLRRAVTPAWQMFSIAQLYKAAEQAVHGAFGKPQRAADLLKGSRPLCMRQHL